MEPHTPHLAFDRLTLALAVLVVALPVTFLQVKNPSMSEVDKIVGALQVQLVPAEKAQPVVKPQPPAKPKAAVVKTATTNSFVNFRAGKSTTSAIITNIESGATVQLRNESDSTWQGVTHQGKNGFIYRSYLNY